MFKQNLFERDLCGTYLFISFDLVNSTAFKLKDAGWPPLFNQFFDYCRLKTKEYFPTSYNWKLIGDEILFYMPVTSTEEIVDAPARVYRIMHLCIEFINQKAETKGILSVKSVIWSAYMKEQRHFPDGKGRNFLIKTMRGRECELDFLGPDIDTGFRAGSFSYQGKLVVGAHLAALLNSVSGSRYICDNLRIISYEKLKGVWSGRHYPIIWYDELWEEPDSMFLYDDEFTSELIHRVKKRDLAHSPNITMIEKVFRDLHKEQELWDLQQGIEEYCHNNVDHSLQFSLPVEHFSEMHLVAMAVNEEGELLIAKNREANLWDFGFTRLQMYRTIEESLVQGYENDFGITLNEINGEFPPLATYSTTSSDNKTIPAIMLLAKVSRESLKDEELDRFKYSQVRWISAEELDCIEEGVTGFRERAEKAFKIWHWIRKHKS